MPPLPPGLTALSPHFEFETEEDTVNLSVTLPLTDPVADPAGIGFYTYDSNRWQRVLDVALDNNGRAARGDFRPLPGNLTVLRVAAQAYVVSASLPRGTSLHGDAGQVQLVSPRDYTPTSDGTVQGTPTDVQRPEGALLVPTIVGSSDDTSAVVNDILADEALRAAHVQEIAGLVQNGGLDGIDLEYSSVDVDLDEEFTGFVTALAEQLRGQQKRLALTLPPPSNQRSAYQWAALGEAVDYIKILPIANPVSYWDTMPEALSRLTEDVDTHKVLLVLSPYSIDGSGDVSQPIGYLQAMVLAAEAAVREPTNPQDIKPDAEITVVARNLDQGEGASPLVWDPDALTVTFALGGTERRRIYIENSYSVGFKLELVQAYALGGVAIADGSGQSDVANIWPKVHELVSAATVNLRRPNDGMLDPVWQAPDGGDLRGDPGATAVTFIPRAAGPLRVVLVVSDGDRRFGRALTIEVGLGEPTPTPSEIATFPPSETPTETPTPEPTVTSPPAGPVIVEVALKADGDDEDSVFTNDETVTPGSDVVYQVIIDNDSDVPITVTSLIDDQFPGAECLTEGGGNVVGTVLAPDDGDYPPTGVFDTGSDQITCLIIGPAPSESGVPLTNGVQVSAQDEEGNSDSDNDTANIITS
jgi:hypothetical protein